MCAFGTEVVCSALVCVCVCEFVCECVWFFGNVVNFGINFPPPHRAEASLKVHFEFFSLSSCVCFWKQLLVYVKKESIIEGSFFRT